MPFISEKLSERGSWRRLSQLERHRAFGDRRRTCPCCRGAGEVSRVGLHLKTCPREGDELTAYVSWLPLGVA